MPETEVEQQPALSISNLVWWLQYEFLTPVIITIEASAKYRQNQETALLAIVAAAQQWNPSMFNKYTAAFFKKGDRQTQVEEFIGMLTRQMVYGTPRAGDAVLIASVSTALQLSAGQTYGTVPPTLTEQQKADEAIAKAMIDLTANPIGFIQTYLSQDKQEEALSQLMSDRYWFFVQVAATMYNEDGELVEKDLLRIRQGIKQGGLTDATQVGGLNTKSAVVLYNLFSADDMRMIDAELRSLGLGSQSERMAFAQNEAHIVLPQLFPDYYTADPTGNRKNYEALEGFIDKHAADIVDDANRAGMSVLDYMYSPQFATFAAERVFERPDPLDVSIEQIGKMGQMLHLSLTELSNRDIRDVLRGVYDNWDSDGRTVSIEQYFADNNLVNLLSAQIAPARELTTMVEAMLGAMMVSVPKKDWRRAIDIYLGAASNYNKEIDLGTYTGEFNTYIKDRNYDSQWTYAVQQARAAAERMAANQLPGGVMTSYDDLMKAVNKAAVARDIRTNPVYASTDPNIVNQYLSEAQRQWNAEMRASPQQLEQALVGFGFFPREAAAVGQYAPQLWEEYAAAYPLSLRVAYATQRASRESMMQSINAAVGQLGLQGTEQEQFLQEQYQMLPAVPVQTWESYQQFLAKKPKELFVGLVPYERPREFWRPTIE